MENTKIISSLRHTEFLDCYQLCQEIDDKRQSFRADDSIIKSENVKEIDIDNLEDIPNGRVDFIVNQIRVKTFINIKKSDRIYVFLNGAKGGVTPQFRRWSYYNYTDSSVINISDPMYDLYSDLKLGWYYGNEKFNLRKDIALLIKKISELLFIKNENICFFGSSGGGAALFEMAHYIPRCTAISINPQIKLMDWNDQGKILENIVGVKLEGDIYHRDDALYYIKNKNCRYLIIMNIRSEEDMEQLERIKDCLNIKINYGLNVIDANFFIWLYDADATPYVSPHSAQDYNCVFYIVDYMVQNNFNIRNLENYIILVNEFWRDRWVQEKKHYSEVLSLSKLKEIRKMEKKIALFGTGGLSEEFNEKYFDIENDNYYDISLVFDNDINKVGKRYKGFEIINPDTYHEWNNCFVIIVVKNEVESIVAQLQSYGLLEGIDFITYKELFKR